MKEIFEAVSKSIWREVAGHAMKKGAEAFVVEGLKAVWDIAKRRRIRRDEWEWTQWKKTQSPDDDDKKKAKATDSDDKSTDAEPDDEESADDDSGSPDAPDDDDNDEEE